MDKSPAAAVAVIAVLIILLLTAYAWYFLPGWKKFSYVAGDDPTWVVGEVGISNLRFKNCLFTIVRGDGVTRTLDATAALNAMAVAYKNQKLNPSSLKLVRPINTFSFIIQGFNDRASVSNPGAPAWLAGVGGASVTLTGYWRVL